MPVTITVGTNSYVTLAEADTFFAQRAFSDAWVGVDDDKARSLIAAARHLDFLYIWKGYPTVTTQAMQWPRNGVQSRTGGSVASDATPQDIKDAQCELAYQWIQSDQLTPSADQFTAEDSASSKGPIKREKLGALERDYFEPKGNLYATEGSEAILRKKYPMIDLLVKPYISSSINTIFRPIVS